MINRKKFDFVLLVLLLALILAGCIAIFSASTSKIGDIQTTQNHWWRQLIFAGLVLGMLYVLLKLPMPVFELVIIPLYVLNIFSLVLVLYTPANGGSHRWFSILGFNYQPSESAKLLTILTVSRIIAKEHLNEFRQMLYGFGLVILPVALILIEPDFGTTLVFWCSLLGMLIAAGLPLFYVLLIISPVISIVLSVQWIALIVWLIVLIYLLMRFRLSWVTITVSVIVNIFSAMIMPVFWNHLKDYQQNRILTFIDP
ncbi:MAG: FtsW/RodA/SpoVE family cell cycle protein, partial [Candidatus Cloacimonadaceae bacterium]|nr:FtsW/RodA/SpoVE family cell cycle protein [Candidatus Cloacimonadaceae bacterium]